MARYIEYNINLEIAIQSSKKRSAPVLRVMPQIEERPTFIVHRINAELARICNPLFKRLGVDLITSRILVIVRENPSVLVGDVQRMMALPQSTVSHQIKRLEQAGLVVRSADGPDKRAFSVHLTQRGEEIALACDRISEALYAELFGDMGNEDIDNLLEKLNQMNQRLAGITLDTAHDVERDGKEVRS